MRRIVPVLIVVLLALIAPSHGAIAQETPAHVLRLATLLPRNRQMTSALTLWNRELATRTGGRLSVRMYWGGAMGDEQTMVRRMRNGQLDGASLTSGGLAQIHQPVLVMQVPGVFSTYTQVDRVRTAIGPELAQGFEREGFTLIGWGDSGRVRLFSREPVRRPRDLLRARAWRPQADVIFNEVLTVAGASGITLSVGEVYGGLRTGMIDVVPGTAIAVTALQWFTSVRYVTGQSDGFLIGGMVVRRGFLDELPADVREALLTSARENQGRFLDTIREADERAYLALIRHGLRETDMRPHEAEWRQVGAEARRRLAGRVYPASLLERVEQIAAQQ